LFTVSRSGTVVTFQGADGTVLKIPATTSVQTIEFSDQEPLTLSIHNGQVMLDDQVIVESKETIACISCNSPSKTQVSQLYVMIFNRPSEGSGNSFWQTQSDMATAATAMLDTTDARAYFGSSLNSNQAFIEHIYLNTLNLTYADVPDDIDHWVGLLKSGVTKGEVVADLIGGIEGYGPGGPYYNPDDAAMVAAYNQFMNRVEVSNYMADTVEEAPNDYQTSTSFNYDLFVTDDPATVTTAKAYIDTIGSSYLTMTEVSQLYVAIFNLASTGQANTYWRESGLDMNSTANAMLDTDFYNSFFGASLNSDQAFIEHIYLNTLNKSFEDDPDGIAFWVRQLEGGASRGEVVAGLVQAIESFGPVGYNYDPDDAETVAAYNQFFNRVAVSNYMAENVDNPPANYAHSTAFDKDLIVTDDAATVTQAKRLIDIMSGAVKCGAYIAPGVWKEFDCYNLAAIGKTTNDDPFSPSWRLIGGYWQWGRKGPDPSVWHSTNTPHFAHGPTGPDASETNAGEISGWDSSYAPNGAWSDSHKTANDPCPTGFRVPTEAQWEGVLDNNTQSTVGTWNYSDTNYSAARFFGIDLMLPAAGYRHDYRSGALNPRGFNGYYWSSSEFGSGFAWSLGIGSGGANPYNYYLRYGFSVRCVAE